MRRSLVPTAYFVLAGAAVAFLVLNIFAWNGGLGDESAQVPATSTAQQPASEATPPPAPLPQPVARSRPAPPHSETALTISATRGDCWVEVRTGSSAGRLLYAGTLPTGKTLRFNQDRLWLRLGAARNVDIVVNGRPSTVPSGTVELVLPT